MSRIQDLTPDEVREVTRLNCPELVGEVFSLAKTIAAEEITRQTRLDAKANMLLGAVAVSLSLLTVVATYASADALKKLDTPVAIESSSFDPSKSAGVRPFCAVPVAGGFVASDRSRPLEAPALATPVHGPGFV